jgi:hypothetical protein
MVNSMPTPSAVSADNSSQSAVQDDTEAQPPICDLFAADGRQLWWATSVPDAHRLIEMRQADPAQFPAWQGNIEIRMWPPAPPKPAKSEVPFELLGYGAEIPPPADGSPMQFIFHGTTLGLGLGTDEIVVLYEDQFLYFDVELALFHVDRFTQGRAHLARLLGFHFSVVLERDAG